MKIKIQVREEHIVNGVCTNPYRCAIAISINDFMPETSVLGGYMMVRGEGMKWENRLRIPLPKIAEKAIDEFDNCPVKGTDRLKYVQPFSFEIEIPDDKIELIWPNTKGLLEKARELVNQSKNCVAV